MIRNIFFLTALLLTISASSVAMMSSDVIPCPFPASSSEDSFFNHLLREALKAGVIEEDELDALKECFSHATEHDKANIQMFLSLATSLRNEK